MPKCHSCKKRLLKSDMHLCLLCNNLFCKECFGEHEAICSSCESEISAVLDERLFSLLEQ